MSLISACMHTTARYWSRKDRQWPRAKRSVKSAVATVIISRCISRFAVSASQSIRCNTFQSGLHEQKDCYATFARTFTGQHSPRYFGIGEISAAQPNFAYGLTHFFKFLGIPAGPVAQRNVKRAYLVR